MRVAKPANAETGELLQLLESCAAGDVLLTGQPGGLSTAINWAGGAPVSHALLVVAPGVAIEARDSRWDLREEGRGVRLVKLDSLALLGFALVVAVRPQAEVQQSQLRAWAAAAVAGTAPFASVGLTAMAPLLLAAQLEARVHRLGPLGPVFAPFLRRRRRHLAEVVADGHHRVICAELVYRGLLSGGVEVDLSVAQFASSLVDLPAALPLNATLSRPAPSEEDLLRQATPSTILAKSSLPSPRWKHLGSALKAGVRQFVKRAGRDHVGDKADLVTPADLMRSASMTTVWTWARSKDANAAEVTLR
jgi:hypothetical protein